MSVAGAGSNVQAPDASAEYWRGLRWPTRWSIPERIRRCSCRSKCGVSSERLMSSSAMPSARSGCGAGRCESTIAITSKTRVGTFMRTSMICRQRSRLQRELVLSAWLVILASACGGQMEPSAGEGGSAGHAGSDSGLADVGGGGAGTPVDCHSLAKSSCALNGCEGWDHLKQLVESEGGALCVPDGPPSDFACFDPEDWAPPCSGGAAISHWRSRHGEVFQSSHDCGPPSYERVVPTISLCD